MNHPFYAQVLTYMAVTKADYCEFVIYSRKGMYHEVVPFDVNKFETLVESCTMFFDKFLLPSVHISGDEAG